MSVKCKLCIVKYFSKGLSELVRLVKASGLDCVVLNVTSSSPELL